MLTSQGKYESALKSYPAKMGQWAASYYRAGEAALLRGDKKIAQKSFQRAIRTITPSVVKKQFASFDDSYTLVGPCHWLPTPDSVSAHSLMLVPASALVASAKCDEPRSSPRCVLHTDALLDHSGEIYHPVYG